MLLVPYVLFVTSSSKLKKIKILLIYTIDKFLYEEYNMGKVFLHIVPHFLYAHHPNSCVSHGAWKKKDNTLQK